MFNASQRRANKNSLTWWSVLKTSWRYLCKTSWRRLKDVLKTFFKTSIRRFEDVLKVSWKRLEDVWKTYSQDEYIGLDRDVLKTSSEDVRLRQTYSSWSRRLQDVFKTSSEDEDERHLQDVFKTSSSRRMFAGNLVNNQSPNHLLDQLQSFECYHVFLNHFYWLIKKNFAWIIRLQSFISTVGRGYFMCALLSIYYLKTCIN